MKKVKMQTTKGTIVLELDDEKAPETVRNFVEYVQAGHYDGTIFHRVIDGFMIQGGGFTKDMNQKKTRAPIRNEASNGLHNKRGTIAMARTMVVDSATSQFFLAHAAGLRLRRVWQGRGRNERRRRHREGEDGLPRSAPERARGSHRRHASDRAPVVTEASGP